jgi:excisionase family DNA binding protein
MVAQTLPDILTPEQVAAYLQVEPQLVYDLIENGQLVASRIGEGFRVQKRHIDLLLSNTQTSPGIVLREYTDVQVEQFLEDDVLDDDAMEVVNAFLSIPNPRDPQRATT